MLKLEEKARDELVHFLGSLLLPSGSGTQRDAAIVFLQKLNTEEPKQSKKEKING